MFRNYEKKLEKLQARRRDEILNESHLSKSFSNTDFGKSTKYALESMREVDPRTRQIALDDANKIIACLNLGLVKYGLSIAFKLQGSVETNTNIKFHSDIDILIFTQLFEQIQPPQAPYIPYTGDTIHDMTYLRDKSLEVLNNSYDKVDSSKSKAIGISISRPQRKVDVVPANWFNSLDYASTQIEYYRGVQLFDSQNKKRLDADFPFLHIQKVNEKDNVVFGALKKLIRLLKTLKADVETENDAINLSSFEITSMMYDIPERQLQIKAWEDLTLLPVASEQLKKLIEDSNYRKSLKSPNGKELVFPDDKKLDDIKKLKLELDTLIVDLSEELFNKYKRLDSQIQYF